jgi:uncharacterized membrane protein YcaP (DUF421 family)
VELVLRASAIYWFLWLVVRGTGKRSLAELSPLDLLLVVVMGDLVQQGVTSEDMSVTGAMVVIATFITWTLLMDALTRRRWTVKRILEGEPVIILRDGAPLMDRLRQERLTVDDLYGAAREQGFARLSDIQIGVLEDDGAFSFIARQQPNRGTTGTADRDR